MVQKRTKEARTDKGSDMVEQTELSHKRLPQQPLPAYVVKQNVAGRYKLSSTRGDSKPLREIPGIQKELKRNPGTTGFLAARKRKGEDEQTITQKHPARGNSAASSSHEPSYQDITIARQRALQTPGTTKRESGTHLILKCKDCVEARGPASPHEIGKAQA